jgi:pre-rRNA-processing protein SRD1
MTFPTQVGNYAFGAMLPQDANLPVQSFERPPLDLEGRMSNVMLAYDSMPNPLSMPTNLDPNSAYAYSIPTTYPATSMGLTQMEQPQFQPPYQSFPQSMPVSYYPQAHSQLPQPQPQPQPAPLARKDPYDTSTDSTANFEDSDFSGQTSDRLQVQMQPRSQRPPPQERRLQPAGPYRASQPVAIQPKKPVPAKGELCARYSSRWLWHRVLLTRRLRLQVISRRGWKSPRLARPSIPVSTRVVDLMYWVLWYVCYMRRDSDIY